MFTEQTSWHQQTILIVEDDHISLQLLCTILKEHNLLTATSGEKALQIAKKEKPDLILLDIMLPEIDGLEVCKLLRSDKATQYLPIIFVTASSGEKIEEQGLRLGAVDYIRKPFSIPIITARINNHLELKRNRDILENMSTLDSLTNIPNRRYFDDMMNREWKRALREKTSLAVMMIDIDYFKTFNDNYGHGEGDKCLKQVAQILQTSLHRGTDVACRYGGEEFVIILPSTDDIGAQIVSNNIHKALEEKAIPHLLTQVKNKKTVSISIGVSFAIPEADINPETILQQADVILYKAKNSGRNQTAVHD
jgi:diguanylate cyclase (GGDEF)-like protein